MIAPVEIFEGDSPVILGLPHTGTWLPEHVAASLNYAGAELRRITSYNVCYTKLLRHR